MVGRFRSRRPGEPEESHGAELLYWLLKAGLGAGLLLLSLYVAYLGNDGWLHVIVMGIGAGLLGESARDSIVGRWIAAVTYLVIGAFGYVTLGYRMTPAVWLIVLLGIGITLYELLRYGIQRTFPLRA